MRRILVCSGVLGGGTALVFALAAATATLFPHGTLVGGNGWNGNVMFGKAVAMPQVAPGFLDDTVTITTDAGPAIEPVPASIESPQPVAAP